MTAPMLPKKDPVTAMRENLEWLRENGASREEIDAEIRKWSRKIASYNEREAAQLPDNPAVVAGLEALQTVASGVPGARMAQAGFRALAGDGDVEQAKRDIASEDVRGLEDSPIARRIAVPAARMVGALALAPLAGGAAIAPEVGTLAGGVSQIAARTRPLLQGVNATARTGAAYGAAEQALTGDPDVSLRERALRTAFGGAVGAGAGAAAQIGGNYLRTRFPRSSKTAHAVFGDIAEETRRTDEVAYGQARAEMQNFQRALQEAQDRAIAENTEREAAREWNRQLTTAQSPPLTLRDALEQQRARSAEVARRAPSPRGSTAEPLAAPTDLRPNQFASTLRTQGYAQSADAPLPENADEILDALRSTARFRDADEATLMAEVRRQAEQARQTRPERPVALPAREQPMRGETVMQARQREALDRRMAERELPPEPRPGPGLGDAGTEPMPVPQYPAALTQALAEPDVVKFVDRLRSTREFRDADPGTLAMELYRQLSRRQGRLGNLMENTEDFLVDEALASREIGRAKAQILSAADEVSPTFRSAIEQHRIKAGEADAARAGYDAMRRYLGNVNPPAKKVMQHAPEAFERAIPEMTRQEATAATRGAVAQIPSQIGFRANATSQLGIIPSLSHLYRASRFLNPLDVQSGTAAPRTLQEALAVSGARAGDEALDFTNAQVERARQWRTRP